MSNSSKQTLAFNKFNGKSYSTGKSNINEILANDNLKFVLNEECLLPPSSSENQTFWNAYDRWIRVNDKARIYILASISDILAKTYESMVSAKDIMDLLQTLYEQSIMHDTFDNVYNLKIKDEISVSKHVLDVLKIINNTA
ncbi:uncharacterized protein LOC120077468 [Benincasa hispida]|uniref:uncharacterized protein LOC120077468 n=1 Tax=Benincasa hispida TaxID=102211 RepID=UPI0019014DD2|nr:uncharacterized protein LOC120077468 [Benincasa hispida]